MNGNVQAFYVKGEALNDNKIYLEGVRRFDAGPRCEKADERPGAGLSVCLKWTKIICG